MIKIKEKEIDCALLRIQVGLDKYSKIQSALQEVNVSRNIQLQKQFNHFYRVRRNQEWRNEFFIILEEYKNRELQFIDAINLLYKKTNRIEASFARKLVATIHPERPVIDTFVLKNTGLKLPYNKAKNRIDKINSIYHQLENSLEEFLKKPNGKYLIDNFIEMYPNYNITEIKMLDFVLWQSRYK